MIKPQGLRDTALKSISIFLNNSPKRQREFQISIVAIEERGESEDEEGGNSTEELEDVDDSDSDDKEHMDDEENDSEEEPELIDPNNSRQQPAEKNIKPLCETRWIEHHTSTEDFKDLYKLLLLCLCTIFEN